MKREKLVLTILILLFLIAIPLTTTKNDASEKLKVGVILPLTGRDAYFGESIRKGLELANKNNSVALVVEDFGSDTPKAVSAVNKLVSVDKVDVLLTSFSEDTLASISTIKENKVPTICIACGSAGLTKQSEYLFRVWPSDAIEVNSIVNYAKNNNFEKVAILQTVSVWEDSLREAFTSGWSENGNVIVNKGMREDEDFRTQLLKIKEFNPDFIYLAVYEQKYPLVIKQLRDLGINATIATTSWINDPLILKACGSYCDGLIVPQYSLPSSWFVSLYHNEYGEYPVLGADVGYDAIAILLNMTSKNNEEIRKQLLSTIYQGASGRIEFDPTGDRKNREVDLYRIQNMTLQQLG